MQGCKRAVNQTTGASLKLTYVLLLDEPYLEFVAVLDVLFVFVSVPKFAATDPLVVDMISRLQFSYSVGCFLFLSANQRMVFGQWRYPAGATLMLHCYPQCFVVLQQMCRILPCSVRDCPLKNMRTLAGRFSNEGCHHS
eukprot:1780177-Amphidinium_carterae.1